ncbi:Anti-repressor SinI [Gracilibacillus orientalis]|uniref:Anti-repressor SinI n=1 Tax=Gracilibacillus orientalis TaxID=334253 RepID=A0A1I4MRY0_9BACI|nr:anti-repressor SinI family protein [Gracilibacillus orientalis]SFM05830.1 Anti-repressor SinI [Gracilibacillus orientalis]
MLTKTNVDCEWIYLMAKAKADGYTVEEIREFLNQSKYKSNVQLN